jgi:hypothetical protein
MARTRAYDYYRAANLAGPDNSGLVISPALILDPTPLCQPVAAEPNGTLRVTSDQSGLYRVDSCPKHVEAHDPCHGARAAAVSGMLLPPGITTRLGRMGTMDAQAQARPRKGGPWQGRVGSGPGSDHESILGMQPEGLQLGTGMSQGCQAGRVVDSSWGHIVKAAPCAATTMRFRFVGAGSSSSANLSEVGSVYYAF